MSHPIKILAFAGSTRRDALNKKLARAAAGLAEQAGAAVTFVDLGDYPIPLYDGDAEQEQGHPQHALALRALFKRHDALIVASPEYNGFFSPLLKNTFDWLSRPIEGEERHVAFKDKPVLLLAATPGESGGKRGLAQLRQLLGNLKAVGHASDYSLPKGSAAFGADGALASDEVRASLGALVREFVDQAGQAGRAARAAAKGVAA